MSEVMNMAGKDTASAKRKLAQDLRTTMDDVEELLRLTAGQVGERMAEVRSRLQTSISDSRSHLANLQAGAVERGRQVSADVEEYVQDNPWKVIGIVALAGLVIGALIARR
jgi:ElaB/YqjD/DUF883 family membrane-anchored ribosome-binding protein